MTRGNGQARLDGLENYYSEFLENHQKFMNIQELDKEHDYFKTDLANLVDDSYFDSKGGFTDFFRELDRVEAQTRTPAVPVGNQNESLYSPSFSMYSFPKINLPKFSGKFSEWENFRYVFRALIHRHAEMPLVLKFSHLRTSLSGDALDQIKSISLSGENYDKAWTALLAYYENNRRLVNQYVSEIYAVKSMKSETSQELKPINREILSPIESLSSIGRTDSLSNDLIVFQILSRPDISVRREWEKHLGDGADPPTFKQLKDFIRAQILIMESLEGSCKSSNNYTKPNPHSKPKRQDFEGSSTQSTYEAFHVNPPSAKFLARI